MSMKRFERIDYDEKSIPQLIKNYLRSYLLVRTWPPEALPDTTRRMDVDLLFCLTVSHHIEIEGAPGETGLKCARWAVEIALDYFYGPWRDGYINEPYVDQKETWDAAMCRKNMPWFDTFREALFCALIVDDIALLDTLLEWADVDLPYDDDIWDVPQTEKDFYILTALALRKTKLPTQAKLRRQIEAGTGKRAKLCLRGHDAIVAGDGKEFMKVLNELLKYHLKREFRADHPGLVVMVEGTILWHVARMADLNLPQLSEEFADRIVRKETFG